MALTQVSTGGVKDGTISNADINASASIAGTKISTSFGNQDIQSNQIQIFGKSVYAEPTSEDFFRIKFNDTGGINNDVGIGQPDSSSLAFNTISNGTIRFYNGTDGEMMRLDASGNLAIGGISNVGTKLHIENASGDAHIRLRGSANYGVLFTRHSDAALTGYVGSGNAVNLGSSNVALSAPLSGGQIIFQTNGTAATDEKMRIDSSGNVGIGTISPAVQLDVRSTSQSTNAILGNFESSAASSGLSSTTVRLIKGTGFGGAIGGFINQGVGSGLLFNTINGGAEATKMSIKNNGFVGIGDDLFDPSYRLHVKDGSTDLISFFQNNKTGNGDIGYISVGLNNFANTGLALFGHTGHTTAGSQAAWFGLSGDDVAGGTGVKAFRGGTIFMAGQLNIGNNNAPNVQARISTSTGEFGAFLETTGTTAVNGIPLIVNRQADNGVMIEFKKSNGVVATIHRNSSNQMVYGGQSDYRLKENNVAISDSLTKVKSLKPYEFNWKDLPDTKVLGFFAHELQEVVPQAVTGTKDEMYEDDDTKPKYQNVDNSHIVPLLVAAVQELTIKTEALETEVAALKAS